MDWNNVRGRSSRRLEAAPLELIETCWRMRSLQKKTRILSCGIYRSGAPGVQVRAGYSEDDMLRSQHTADVESAREIAEAWRQAVLPVGGFKELFAPKRDKW